MDDWPENHDKPGTQKRRRITVGRLVKWGLVVFLVGFFMPIFPPWGFVGGFFNHLYFWKNPGRAGTAIAVSRELFLDVSDYHRTPYYYDPRYRNANYAREMRDKLRWCRPEDVRRLESGEPRPCIATYTKTNSHCSTWLNDFSCNGLGISSALWGDEGLRERIIEAALNPCKYLYDPGTGVVEDKPRTLEKRQMSKFGTVMQSYDSHVVPWGGSACETYRVLAHPAIKIPFFRPANETQTVYISIIHPSSSPTSRPGTVLAVYKATRRRDVIKGEYIEGDLEELLQLALRCIDEQGCSKF